MRQKIFNVPMRRKREGKTDYRKRLKLLLSHKPRLVVRPSLKNITAQIIEYHQEGDKVIVSSNSSELEKFGWVFSKSNVPAAYLTGLLAGIRAISKGIKKAILDVGLHTPTKGSKIFACLKGAADAGLEVPFSKDILPSEERIKGKHIIAYVELLKKDGKKYEKQFPECIKKDIDISQLPKIFDEAKNRIIREGK